MMQKIALNHEAALLIRSFTATWHVEKISIVFLWTNIPQAFRPYSGPMCTSKDKAKGNGFPSFEEQKIWLVVSSDLVSLGALGEAGPEEKSFEEVHKFLTDFSAVSTW